LRATDEFYLWQRTQRWAGAHGTAAAVDRFFVNPLLDRRFMALALGPAPDEKRGSRLTGRLMRRLDPELAAIPLDSGLVPDRLGRGGLRTRAAVTRVAAGKAVVKLRQRVTGGRRTQLGAATVAEAVVRHWRAEPDRPAALRDTGMVRPDWLDGLLDGSHTADPGTVAFLLNVLVATEATSGRPAPSGAEVARVAT
jgi:asparagine synthase (glutamine-hydrolysing)